MLKTTRLFKAILAVSLCLTATLPAVAQQSCPMVQMQVERLPDLRVPRIGHSIALVNGEVTVFGGHTTGFIPTPTAEYFRNGEWHLMQMVYPHDHATIAVTPTGEVLLAGGHKEELGVGQTFTLELYTPATHSFKGYGCLDQRRCFANALPLDSGRIAISGNWFHDDGIELYDGSRQCKYVKPVAQQRSLPHIIRTAKDNAIIFSARDIHAEDFDTIIIDRLHGESFTVSLFDTWKPYCYPVGYHGSCFIGDEAKNEYVSLIQVMKGDSIMAVARVHGENFSLLPTTNPIPMRSQWGPITWFCHILADRKAGRAYIWGYGEDKGDHHIYVAAIDYLKTPAPITLLYSEPIDSIGRSQPVLTDDGDLMLVGGVVEHNNNYDASATVLLLHVGTEKVAITAGNYMWLWLLLASLLLITAVAVILWRRHRKHQHPNDQTTTPPQPSQGREKTPNEQTTNTPNDQLMERLCRYMDEQQPYLSSELKVQDVADALGTNRTYVSNCIKNIRGCSFSQFVNGYRVEYAQQLLRSNADIKLSEVWASSGFSSESSFFRAFKAVTGTTPKDWTVEQ